ncbi:MAG: DUF4159 domain-containing protein [Bdellovibrionales bacterium]
MGAVFGNFIFLNPWLLAALAALPALWFLLRLMPPAPKKVFLPSVRFLQGLVPDERTPSKTPWRILLLRIIMAALVIFAFARPVLNPSAQLSTASTIRIVIDNGWSAADIRDTQIETASDIIAQADRAGQSVYISTTAPIAGGDTPATFGPLSAAEAASVIKGLSPLPWPADYNAVLEHINAADKVINTLWLSDGLDKDGLSPLAEALQKQGSLSIYTPAPENLPLALDFDPKAGRDERFRIIVPDAMPDRYPLTLHGVDENGRVIGLQDVVVDTKSLTPPSVALDIPETLRGELRQIRIAGRSNAGSVLILGERFARKDVGIVSPLEDGEAKPFIEASYYLTRALEPYADVKTGPLNDVIAAKPAMLILPDIGAMGAGDLNHLEDWVRSGGLLLRFAGPAMAKAGGEPFLTPVGLRSGTRAMDGQLRWENPPKLAPFEEASPFYGLAPHEDITVRQQLLAEPSPDLPQKTWASLDDGTPLITAAPLDRGLLVMVHTTASPDWSDLPLSGVFAQILGRLVKMSGAPLEATHAEMTGTLSPIWVLDGFGRVSDATGSVAAIDAAQLGNTAVTSATPPGLYGRGPVQSALNLGPQINHLQAMPALSGAARYVYGNTYERDLMPALLTAALILLLLDWAVMLALSTQFRMRRLGRLGGRVAAVVLLMVAAPLTAQAQDVPPSDFKYADGLYLAYIKSSDPSANVIAQAGLANLAAALTRRTSAEPDGVAALDPETDTLAFFPLIYWPVSPSDPPLSDAALGNVQSFLDHGGTILFDTRNAAGETRFLQNIIGHLNVPALAPAPKDHVLGKSFYLLESFPGLYNGGDVWVETTSAGGRDGVSSVIIGANDWAGAWAQAGGRDYRASTSARQNEMAIRFGVNLVMYALTGNYKADQVHVQQILERLDQ